jgi:hypothetical protein
VVAVDVDLADPCQINGFGAVRNGLLHSTHVLQRGLGDRLQIQFGVDRLDLDLAGQRDIGAPDADFQIVGVGGAAFPHPRRGHHRLQPLRIGVGPLGAFPLAGRGGANLGRRRRQVAQILGALGIDFLGGHFGGAALGLHGLEQPECHHGHEEQVHRVHLPDAGDEHHDHHADDGGPEHERQRLADRLDRDGAGQLRGWVDQKLLVDPDRARQPAAGSENLTHRGSFVLLVRDQGVVFG